jgi:hypothetical protein
MPDQPIESAIIIWVALIFTKVFFWNRLEKYVSTSIEEFWIFSLYSSLWQVSYGVPLQVV